MGVLTVIKSVNYFLSVLVGIEVIFTVVVEVVVVVVVVVSPPYMIHTHLPMFLPSTIAIHIFVQSSLKSLYID